MAALPSAKKMYYRIIDENIKVCLSVPVYSVELFNLTNRNRRYLKKWLPWLDSIMSPEDTKEFIELQLSPHFLISSGGVSFKVFASEL
jgi:hypothetical protein